MDTNSVFSRTEIDGTILSDQMYNFLLGAVLFWGFFLNWLIVKIVDPTAVLDVMSIWMFFLMYFASCLCGIWLFTRSTRPVISFLGYNLVVVPFGFVVNIIVAGYDDAIVVNAMEVTCGVVAVMMMMGTVFPRFFQKISTTLFLGTGPGHLLRNVPAVHGARATRLDRLGGGVALLRVHRLRLGAGQSDPKNRRQCHRQRGGALHGYHQPVSADSPDHGGGRVGVDGRSWPAAVTVSFFFYSSR